MRQRIKDVAASRNLSDEEIRPVLRLKHQEIGRFCEARGVNLGWLLEGEGRIFKGVPTLKRGRRFRKRNRQRLAAHARRLKR
jgi:hypothetical protein